MRRSRSTWNAVRVGDGSSGWSRFAPALFVAYGARLVRSDSSWRSRIRSAATDFVRESRELRSVTLAMALQVTVRQRGDLPRPGAAVRPGMGPIAADGGAVRLGRARGVHGSA